MDKKIEPVTSEEIISLRKISNCSLSEAENALKKIKLHNYVESVENVDELKKVIHLLIHKVYKE